VERAAGEEKLNRLRAAIIRTGYGRAFGHAGDLFQALVGLGIAGDDLRTALARGAAFLPEPTAVATDVAGRERIDDFRKQLGNPSPPSGWIEDFHLQAVDHARHTKQNGRHCWRPLAYRSS
jgi:hypothetical protein